jgi:hypothetical protein
MLPPSATASARRAAGLLRNISRTGYWVEWWRRFEPASGNEPKLKDPFGRYVIATFVNGTNS